jgi:hypothetical protein
MSTDEKASGIPIKDLWEITVKEIKDPILLTILAVGLLLLYLSMTPQGESYKWQMTFLGVLAALVGMTKWVIGVVSGHGEELALSELGRHLRSAKNVRSDDMIQEMGRMILESSDDPWIIDKAQRLAKRTREKTELSDIPRLYEKKGIQPDDVQNAKKIVQTIVNQVSWKRHRVFVAADTSEQLLQYPSTMLLSEEIYGGCADKVVLLCTLLRALKFRTRFKWAVGGIETKYMHVWAEVCLPAEQGKYEWFSIDPSKAGFQIGEKKDWEEYWKKYFVPNGFHSSEKAESCNLD